jgi:hypothetical protein
MSSGIANQSHKLIQRTTNKAYIHFTTSYLVARKPRHGPSGLISRPLLIASYNVCTPNAAKVGEAKGSCERRMLPRPP